MFKTKLALIACALVLALGAIATLVHADGNTVIVAMVQQPHGYICRHMPQAEWDAHMANGTLPVGKYYDVSATLDQLNALNIWGFHETLQEVEQVFVQNNMAWPCRWKAPEVS